MADEKDKTTDTGDEGVDTEESWDETMTIEETREQLAAMYLNLLDQQKWGLIGTFAKVKAMIGNQDAEVKNPIKKQAIQYMIGKSETTDTKTKFFDKIRENVKKNASEKIGVSLLKDAEGKSIVGYDQAKLSKMKALIENNKDNKTALENLMAQIQEGVDPIETTDGYVPETDNTTTHTDNEVIRPIYTTYAALKVGEYISQDEITYVNENAKSIVEDLETKWDLSEIKEIKDKDGNIVLKCRGETPYIHSKAAADLIGLALLYHKKTGQNILLESAYRTIAHQARLKKENAAKGTPTADPWYSWHNLWYSIDVSTATRYANKIGWIDGAKKLAKLFNFNPISSEDRHFDYKDFVDKYYDDREARLPEAQKLDKLFSDEQEPVSAAA